MSHFVEVSEGVQLDADNVTAFNIILDERHLTGGKDGERIEVDYRDLPHGSIGVIATGDGVLEPVDAGHFLAYVYGGPNTKICYPIGAIVDLDFSRIPDESDSLVFQDGAIISLSRSTEPLFN